MIRRLGDGVFPVEVLVTFENGDTIEEHWAGDERWRELVYTRRSRRALLSSIRSGTAARRELHQQLADAGATVVAGRPEVDAQVDGVAAGRHAFVGLFA